MQLRDIMTASVTLADPEMTIKEAALKMRNDDIGMLPVGENDRLVGTITDRDIVVSAVAEGKDPSETKIREIMSPGIKYVFEDQSVEDAAKVMGEHQIRRLPVLNRDKRLIGIVAMADLAVKGTNKTTVAKAVEKVSMH